MKYQQKFINDLCKAYTKCITVNQDGTAEIVRKYYLERDAILASFSFGRRNIVHTLTKKEQPLIIQLRDSGRNFPIYEIKVSLTKEQAKKSNIIKTHAKITYSHSLPFPKFPLLSKGI